MIIFEGKGQKLDNQEIRNRTSFLENVELFCRGNYGKKIQCKEYISCARDTEDEIHPDNISYDRHVTSYSSFSFIMEYAGFSGTMMMIGGEDEELLEICADNIFYGEYTGTSFVTIEKLEGKYTRTIKVFLA